ncbi:EFh [Seminavis robusta]|uniref:EFh n=1 Tax=Seminavis robusta TaxID=568900 RepID=A0A9N8DIJ9_9STRA|nr:EFh [Seminavis robusta]|eukprot:Sro163_g073260.1 EFh (488) ;mRNA; f:58564-60127
MGEDELDLDQELAALDLDTNFLESTDSLEEAQDDDDDAIDPIPIAEAATPPRATTPPRTASPKPPSSKSNLGDWANRPEIYSRHYKPNPQERAELEQIATLLGVKSGLLKSGGKNPLESIFGGGGNGDDATKDEDPHNPQCQWNRLVVGKATQQTQNLPISLLLKQGTVLYKDVDDDGETTTHHGCQLLLFTRGFLIAKPETVSAGLFGRQKSEILTPLGSALWTNVRQIQTTVHQTLKLTCHDGTTTFEVLPSQDVATWTKVLQTAAIQAHAQFLSAAQHTERGWQYRLCQTHWFTEAVTGVWEDVGLEFATKDSAEQGLDQLDSYNHYAPLHYATRAGHLDVIQHLLQAGANPNVEDGEGKTPMYYAERDQLHHAIVSVLTEFGGTHSQKAEEEMRGELFGKVADTERAREEKREAEASAAKAAQEKAATAQSQMAQNLNAMHKRGEMIEELGDKASDLQDGAQDYADMAAQLKEKLKKKSVWGF